LVLLGAGQGSRLGSKLPKGFVDLGLNQDKCLFHVFADRLKVIQRLAHLYRPDKAMLRETDSIHVYVMTSTENDEITRKKFKEHLNFGLWKKNIHFFTQGSIPATDMDGKIFMSDRLRVFMSPDGNGGLYEAIQNNGLIEEWKNKGIEYVHVMGIDNLLARPVDPVLMGMLKGVKGEYSGLDLVSQYVKS
jgi:UDP-N-acetylglucosamine/UDP-N-acetylgalactosamine diphosphorylase